MTMTSNDKARLNDLSDKANAAYKAARAARLEVTKAYAQCAAGQGTGPSIELIETAERLEAEADKLWSQQQAAWSLFTF
ncbi:MAG: hypothetical protein KF796_19445 [Ramlibacter sp.]|nr:hypothetical protein [Ramlibacter sp.]